MATPPFPMPVTVTPVSPNVDQFTGNAPFLGAGPQGIAGLNVLHDLMLQQHPEWANSMQFEGNDAGKFRITGAPEMQSALEGALGQVQADPMFAGFVPGQSDQQATGYAQGQLSPVPAPTVSPATGQMTQAAAQPGSSVLSTGLGQVNWTPSATTAGWNGQNWWPTAGGGTFPSGLFPNNFAEAVRYMYGHNLTDPGFTLPTLWNTPPPPVAPPVLPPPVTSGGGDGGVASPMQMATTPPATPMPFAAPAPIAPGFDPNLTGPGGPSFSGGGDRGVNLGSNGFGTVDMRGGDNPNQGVIGYGGGAGAGAGVGGGDVAPGNDLGAENY